MRQTMEARAGGVVDEEEGKEGEENMRSDDRPVFVNVAEVDLPVAPDDMGVHTDHAAEINSSECAPSAEVAGNDDEEEGPTSSSKIPGGGRPPPPPTVASSKQPTDGTEEGDKGADLPTTSRPPSRRRCLRVFGFLGSICIAVGIYFYLLLKRSDVLLQPEEISIAFENGGIQTNVTMKSQFLPGGVWDQFAIRFGKAQCSVSSRIEDKRPGYLLRDGTSRHLFDVRLVGDGSGHKISNGLTRRGVWQFALESGEFFQRLMLCLPRQVSHGRSPCLFFFAAQTTQSISKPFATAFGRCAANS